MPGTAGHAVSSATTVLPASTVLLVDDNDELRQATRELLEEMGHRVTEASRAAEALEIFASGAEGGFDVLVSDVFMPGASGLELTEILLARDHDLAVLLISSRGGEPELRRRVAMGDVAFLAKPFSAGELAAAVVEARRRGAGRPGDSRPQLPAGRPVAGRSAATKSPARRGTGPAWKLAAVVVTVLGMGVLLRGFEPSAPTLPAPVADGARRSAVIEPFTPVGTVAAAPEALRWRPVPGSDAYAVRLRGVDGADLWQARVDAPRAPLPADVAAGLRRAVTYYWSVDALEAGGGRLASSGAVRFSIALGRRQNTSDRP